MFNILNIKAFITNAQKIPKSLAGVIWILSGSGVVATCNFFNFCVKMIIYFRLNFKRKLFSKVISHVYNLVTLGLSVYLKQNDILCHCNLF